MECKFKHLKPEEVIKLYCSSMYCYHCNEQSSYKGSAIYKGHTLQDGITYDAFAITFICPGCKKVVDYYFESCQGQVYCLNLTSLEVSVGSE